MKNEKPKRKVGRPKKNSLEKKQRQQFLGLGDLLDPKKPNYEFAQKIKSGQTVLCECCGKVAKLYKRKLTPSHCVALLRVYFHYKHSPEVNDVLDYFEYKKLFSGEYAALQTHFLQLAYWDLIEAKGRLDEHGNFIREGNLYRISEQGIKYAQRERGIPKEVQLYNGKVYAHNIERFVTIDDVLEESGFKYNEFLPTT
jgi:hypothetical protein